MITDQTAMNQPSNTEFGDHPRIATLYSLPVDRSWVALLITRPLIMSCTTCLYNAAPATTQRPKTAPRPSSAVRDAVAVPKIAPPSRSEVQVCTVAPTQLGSRLCKGQNSQSAPR